jgi:hypothetical protein
VDLPIHPLFKYVVEKQISSHGISPQAVCKYLSRAATLAASAAAIGEGKGRTIY